MRDIISITDLSLRTPSLESDLWNKSKKIQPLFLSLSISTDVSDEAITDSLLGDSLNYGTVTKVIEKAIKELDLENLELEILAELLCKVIIFNGKAPNVLLELTRPKALLTAESIGVSIYRSKSDYILPSSSSTSTSSISPLDYTLSSTSINPLQDKFFIRNLRRLIIIGVNDCEREDEQEVIVNLEFAAEEMLSPYTGLGRNGWKGWRGIVKKVESHLTQSRPLTIEAITTSISQIVLTPPTTSTSISSFNVPQTTVKLSKPHALMFAKYPSVQVTRSRSDFFLPNGTLKTSLSRGLTTSSIHDSSVTSGGDEKSETSTTPTDIDDLVVEGRGIHTVYLGIGTNLGERVGNISKALKELEKSNLDGGGGKTKVVDTSFLYESEAMYVKEQNNFLNAAVKIETELEPLELLSLLKNVENILGREKTVRNGPRVIDLDILLYDDLIFDSSSDTTSPLKNEDGEDRWLKIPHSSIAEREFVLRPLADLIPNFIHPTLRLSTSTLLTNILSQSPSTLHRIIPLTTSTTHPLASRTLIMSILNATPDSFSDGGDNFDLQIATTNALNQIKQGVDILDIGGMSTRPGAEEVEELIEINRVVPLIQKIRASGGKASIIPISIDTFRPQVAKAAIEAGATIINDVLGGSMKGMLEMMKELDVPVILMHSRGMPKTMNSLTKYEKEDVVEGVKIELEFRINNALKIGIKRWNIIIDPGIGFAKTFQQNLILLKSLDKLLNSGELGQFPSLVGLSRKKFLGTLIGKETEEAKERIWATASGVTVSIAGGCDIVRVHDLKEMVDVVKVADGIYRS